MRKNTLEIAKGGIFAALFIVISFIFTADIRIAQSVVQFFKLIIVACYCVKARKEYIPVYASVVLILGFILLPINVSVVYNVPAVIYGLIIAYAIQRFNTIGCLLCSFITNSLTIIYEYCLFHFVTGQDLFAVYSKSLLSSASRISFLEKNMTYLDERIVVFTIIALVFDSIISSIIIFFSSKILLERILKIHKND